MCCFVRFRIVLGVLMAVRGCARIVVLGWFQVLIKLTVWCAT